MKKILINLKDWFNYKENLEFVKKLNDEEIILFPSLPYLHLYKGFKNIELGTQDISMYEKGAHTGSVSIEHLKDFNINWTILNHKELKITNKTIFAEKINNSFINDINVVVCLNSTNKKEMNFLISVFSLVDKRCKIYLAYEPKDIMTVANIKKDLEIIKNYMSKKSKRYFKYIYGTNVNIDNIEIFNKELNVDGYLISRNALDPANIKTIINKTK